MRGSYLLHPGQSLEIGHFPYPQELERILEEGGRPSKCGLLLQAGLAFFAFENKLFLWSFMADAK